MAEVKLFLLGDLWRLSRRSALVPGTGDMPFQARKSLAAPASMKDVLESLGIPHCEVGSIRSGAPGKSGATSVGLSDVVDGGETLTVAAAEPRPLTDPRFLCDQHLGKLARLLRMTGFDTTWNGNWLEAEIARRAVNEGRVVLSRNRQLLKRKTMDRALLIRSDLPDEQLGEVLTRFELTAAVRWFGRCSLCNGLLQAVAKADIEDRIPPRTRKWLDLYYVCRTCDQLYWEGTHVQAVRRRLAAVVAGIPSRRSE